MQRNKCARTRAQQIATPQSVDIRCNELGLHIEATVRQEYDTNKKPNKEAKNKSFRLKEKICSEQCK